MPPFQPLKQLITLLNLGFSYSEFHGFAGDDFVGRVGETACGRQAGTYKARRLTAEEERALSPRLRLPSPHLRQ
jgi:hypothetical protein